MRAGATPDAEPGIVGKQRSVHNTYFTLPVLFIMISNHYPITYNHEFNWAVLIAMIIITAAVRQYFVLRHFGKQKPLILVGAAVALIALAYTIAPEKKTLSEADKQQQVDVAKVAQIIETRCASCHSANPTDDIFKVAPAGVIFDDIQSISQWASRIKARSVDSKDMPLLNKTNMTDEERDYLALWYAKGGAAE